MSEETPDPKFFGVRKFIALATVGTYLVVEVAMFCLKAWVAITTTVPIDYDILRLVAAAGTAYGFYFYKRTMENGK